MRKLAYLFASFYTEILFILMAKPELFVEAIESMTWPWILFEEAIRLGFAVTVLGAASTSRMPMFLRAIGVLAILEGIFFVIMGSEGLLSIHNSVFGENIALSRAVVMSSLILIGVVAYGLMPPREDDAVPLGIAE